MLQNNKETVYQLSSVTAIYLFVSVISIIIRISLVLSFHWVPIWLLGYILILSGFFMGNILRRLRPKILAYIREKYSATQALSDYFSRAVLLVSFIIPILAAIIGFIPNSPWRILFEMLFMLIYFTIGFRAGRYHSGDILSGTCRNAGIAVLLIGYAVTLFWKACFFFQAPVLVMTFIFILISLIVSNHSNLDVEFIKKGTYLSGVPKNLRVYNLAMVIASFIIFVAMLSLRKIVEFILGIIGIIIGFFIKIYLYLASLLISDHGDNFENQAQSPMELPPAAGNNSHLAEIIILLIFILVLIIFRKQILSAIRKVMHSISSFIKRILKSVVNITEDSNAEYVDSLEIIEPDNPPFWKSGTGRKVKKSTIMNDPALLVRHTYAQIVHILYKRGLKYQESNTSMEICREHDAGIEQNDSLGPVTEIYNQVRYGQKKPTPEQVLSVTLAHKKIKKN